MNLHDRDIIRAAKREGAHVAKIEAARNLLAMKVLTLEQIAQAQNLPLEEVQKIAVEMKTN